MKRIALTGTLVGALMLLPLAAFCWGSMGHRTVAMIAYNRLPSEQKLWANDCLKALLGAPADVKSSFVEAANWPDDLKSKGVHKYDDWHFTNIPFRADSVTVPKEATPKVNAVWAIHYIDSIMAKGAASPAQIAEYLTLIIHLVGDLHQPLHSTSMHSKALPNGDRGGNDFLLKGSKKLHGLWDDGCGYFDEVKKMKDTDLKKLGTVEKVVAVVTKAYPPEKIKDLSKLDPQVWAQESHVLAIQYGYRGKQGTDGTTLKPKEAPTAYYLQAAQKVVAQRLAAAGYRLAMVLDVIYKSVKAG